ncbi:MAG: hypothetical protein ACLTCQ_08005 [Enterocloster bolteae]
MARAGLRIQPEEYMVLQILSLIGGAVLGMYLGFMFDRDILFLAVAGLYAGYTVFRLFSAENAPAPEFYSRTAAGIAGFA